jgi:hypothetical protein
MPPKSMAMFSMATPYRSWISFSQTKASRNRSVMEGTASSAPTAATVSFSSRPSFM